jgi:hypothetical protein
MKWIVVMKYIFISVISLLLLAVAGCDYQNRNIERLRPTTAVKQALYISGVIVNKSNQELGFYTDVTSSRYSPLNITSLKIRLTTPYYEQEYIYGGTNQSRESIDKFFVTLYGTKKNEEVDEFQHMTIHVKSLIVLGVPYVVNFTESQYGTQAVVEFTIPPSNGQDIYIGLP